MSDKRPARMSARIQIGGIFEDVAFAKRREKRRKQNKLAKAARRKNR